MLLQTGRRGLMTWSGSAAPPRLCPGTRVSLKLPKLRVWQPWRVDTVVDQRHFRIARACIAWRSEFELIRRAGGIRTRQLHRILRLEGQILQCTGLTPKSHLGHNRLHDWL
jgi:hypothetical protein